MNHATISTFARIAVVACLSGPLWVSGPAHAAPAGPQPSPPRIVIDCDRPALPSQRDVGELLGQHNLGQVYASRAALMAEARRACLRAPAHVKRVAFDAPTPRPSEERHVADSRRGR